MAQDYYAIVSAQRKFVNAQTSLREADQFLDITQKQEQGGEVAHADVVKAQITQRQRQRDLQDAQLAIGKSRIALGVLIFPDLAPITTWRTIWRSPHCFRRYPKRRRRPRPPVRISGREVHYYAVRL